MKHYLISYTRENLRTGARFAGAMPIYAESKAAAIERFYESQPLDADVTIKGITVKKRPAQTFD